MLQVVDRSKATCNYICMSTKTIAVRSDIYDRLAREKRDMESFTLLIDRLMSNNPSRGTCGDAVEAAAKLWRQGGDDAQDANRMDELLVERRAETNWEFTPLL